MNQEQKDIIQSLRDMADYLEGREFDTSYGIGFSNPELHLFTDGPGFLTNVKRMGGFVREFTDYSAQAVRKFGGAKFIVHASRHTVCEKVEVGVRVVPATPERVIAAQPEHIEPVYEYKCPESLLGSN